MRQRLAGITLINADSMGRGIMPALLKILVFARACAQSNKERTSFKNARSRLPD
jgi:hypothetical protein